MRSFLVSVLLSVAGLSTALTTEECGIPASGGAAAGAVIAQEFLDNFPLDGDAEFFVILKQQADLSAARRLQRKEAKGRFVFETLRRVADSSQKDIRAWLDDRGAAYRPYWIRNMLLVTGDLSLLLDLAARPDVAAIRPNRIANFINPGMSHDATESTYAAGWNLTQIQADRVWSELGVRGEGIVVMDNDTGAQWTHPALKDHYRGWNGSAANHNYNWHDPGGMFPSEPGDNNGHGTHTTGSMVGDDGGSNQIGVAPAAKWIACKACATNSCSDSHILACFEWALAPTDLSGANPDPGKAPHVMNNSWGGGGGDDWCYDEVKALVTAGIFMSFSAGNSGSGCNTLGSPGDYDIVMGSGAVAEGGAIASFSSRGPSAMPTAVPKPNVVAPGVSVRSSVPTNSYANSNGTSMAAPHTSGLVALLWSADNGLIGDIAQTRSIIEQSAHPTEDGQCSAATRPNAVYGWGEINCYDAVQPRVGPTRTPTSTPTITPTRTPTATPVPQAEMALNGASFARGDFFSATFRLNRPIERPFTVFAVVVLPDGSMLDALSLGPDIAPVASNVPRLDPLSYPLISLNLPAGAPQGSYRVMAGFFDPGIAIRGPQDAFLLASAPFRLN